jgi:hypothetical protein
MLRAVKVLDLEFSSYYEMALCAWNVHKIDDSMVPVPTTQKEFNECAYDLEQYMLANNLTWEG